VGAQTFDSFGSGILIATTYRLIGLPFVRDMNRAHGHGKLEASHPIDPVQQSH
jgi:hypothetical protein